MEQEVLFVCMLQPAEVSEVSSRFRGEIAEVRAFLTHAGISVGAVGATSQVADRLAKDPAFHRDLVSHVWVILDARGTALRHGELLAVLAIAAAGVGNAPTTPESVAHQLLRFLMEARHTLEGTPVRHPVPASATATTSAGAPPASSRPEHRAESATQPGAIPHRDRPISAKPAPVTGIEQAPAASRSAARRPVVLVLIACLAAGLATLSWLALRPGRAPGQSGTGTAPPNLAAATAERSRLQAPGADAGLASSVAGQREPARNARFLPASPLARPAASQPNAQTEAALPANPDVASRDVAVTTASQLAPIAPGPPMAPPAALPFGGNASAQPPRPSAIASRSSRPAVASPVIVPADALSRRLDSPKLPAYAADPEPDRRKYPRLLRRHPADSSQEASADPVLTAEMRAPDLSTPALRRNTPAPVSRAVVNTTCLGMMAGNLISAAAPPYPAAAAAARVQGTVKIQATVDRDGSISSARVVSGPPLLRDAAMDAVQRWRYKPYMAGGKPSPTATTAVVEFELQ